MYPFDLLRSFTRDSENKPARQLNIEIPFLHRLKNAGSSWSLHTNRPQGKPCIKHCNTYMFAILLVTPISHCRFQCSARMQGTVVDMQPQSAGPALSLNQNIDHSSRPETLFCTAIVAFIRKSTCTPKLNV